jgi:hypothetical protein
VRVGEGGVGGEINLLHPFTLYAHKYTEPKINILNTITKEEFILF